MDCIAMGYGGAPLARILVGQENNLFYVINPSVANAGRISAHAGVGFPKNSVFRFDQDLFEALTSAYSNRDSGRLDKLWSAATPL